MAESVHPVLRTALAANHTSGHLDRSKAVFDYIGVRLDLADAVWKDETEIALRAKKRPLAQGVENHRGKGGRAVGRLRFELADLVRSIGPLSYIDLAPLE